MLSPTKQCQYGAQSHGGFGNIGTKWFLPKRSWTWKSYGTLLLQGRGCGYHLRCKILVTPGNLGLIDHENACMEWVK